MRPLPVINLVYFHLLFYGQMWYFSACRGYELTLYTHDLHAFMRRQDIEIQLWRLNNPGLWIWCFQAFVEDLITPNFLVHKIRMLVHELLHVVVVKTKIKMYGLFSVCFEMVKYYRSVHYYNDHRSVERSNANLGCFPHWWFLLGRQGCCNVNNVMSVCAHVYMWVHVSMSVNIVWGTGN
jgi:hypothetical protein